MLQAINYKGLLGSKNSDFIDVLIDLKTSKTKGKNQKTRKNEILINFTADFLQKKLKIDRVYVN